MVRIELRTRDHKLVGYANMPLMNPAPEIIMWGQRTFVRSPQNESLYYEGMIWIVSNECVSLAKGC